MSTLLSRLVRPLEFSGRGGYWEICRIAYPLIILGASNTVMQFTDRKFLASVSTADVAAALPAGILYFSLFCIFLCAAGFTSAIVAQYHGAGDRQAVLTAVWSGFYFAVAAGLAIAFLIPPVGHGLIRLAGHTPDLVARELDYFGALLPSGVFACLGAPFFAFFSGRGKTVPVAVINIFACVLNIGLDYLFIFGWGPLPPFGIFGAGVATSLAALISLLLVFGYFLLQNQREYPTRRDRLPSWDGIVRLIRFGMPSGVQIAFDVGAFTIITFAIGYLGTLPLAAHVVALSINNMFFIPLLGLSDATAILVGQYIGRAKHAIARRIVFRSWRIGMLYMLLGGIVYLVFPVTLAEMFGPDQEREQFQTIVPTIRCLLAIAFGFNMVDTLKFIFTAALRGAGDTRAVMIICMACAYLLMVPGVLVLILVLNASVLTVWSFLVAVATLEGLLIVRRFRSDRWRHIRMIRPPAKISRLDDQAAGVR